MVGAERDVLCPYSAHIATATHTVAMSQYSGVHPPLFKAIHKILLLLYDIIEGLLVLGLVMIQRLQTGALHLSP